MKRTLLVLTCLSALSLAALADDNEETKPDNTATNEYYLIAVHADESEDVDRAKDIFKTAGAEDISTVSEASAPKV